MTKRTILIADDQPHVLRVLTLMLQKEGYAVETVSDGARALDRLRGHEHPDVLITDIQMPVMTGRELCQRIAEEFPQRNFLILVMTSMTEREERDWVRDLSDIQFVEKPVSPRALAATLRSRFAERAEAPNG